MMLLNLNVVSAINPTIDTIYTYNNGLSIKGQDKLLGIAIPCRVRLFERISGRLIADVVTDNSGLYEFNHLVKASFFVVAHHPASQFNAVIQDNVVPK